MSIRWQYVSRVLVVLGVLIGLVTLYFTWSEIRSVRLNQSADLVLRLDEVLSQPVFLRMMAVIEDKSPILKEHGGKFERWELDAYLGSYETIDNLYQNGLIRDDMLYSAFSYNIVQAFKNKEISTYVESLQGEDPEIFAGFQELARVLDTSL